MTASADDLPLAAEFPAATREEWRKLVEGVLKGAAFDARLVAKTYDGLAIEPLYGRKADARPIAGRRPGTAWWIMQRVDHPDAAAANAEALHDLENGAIGLALVFAGGIGAYGYGLAANKETLARAFTGIHLDAGIASTSTPAHAIPARSSPRWCSAAASPQPPPTSASATTPSARRRRAAPARCLGTSRRRLSLRRFEN